MQVKKHNTIQGDWVKVKEDINNGDVIKITDEGRIVSGDYGDRNVFKVETKNGVKDLSFNQTTMNYIIDVYGEETKAWIEKKVKVWIIKSNVGGKMRDVVYLTEPSWVETSDGFAPASGVKDEEIPVINEGDYEEEYEG